MIDAGTYRKHDELIELTEQEVLEAARRDADLAQALANLAALPGVEVWKVSWAAETRWRIGLRRTVPAVTTVTVQGTPKRPRGRKQPHVAS